jgi:hypothetical protein
MAAMQHVEATVGKNQRARQLRNAASQRCVGAYFLLENRG